MIWHHREIKDDQMKVGAVATGSVLATDAAWSVLQQGGNAVDAAEQSNCKTIFNGAKQSNI